MLTQNGRRILLAEHKHVAPALMCAPTLASAFGLDKHQRFTNALALQGGVNREFETVSAIGLRTEMSTGIKPFGILLDIRRQRWAFVTQTVLDVSVFDESSSQAHSSGRRSRFELLSQSAVTRLPTHGSEECLRRQIRVGRCGLGFACGMWKLLLHGVNEFDQRRLQCQPGRVATAGCFGYLLQENLRVTCGALSQT